MPKISVNIVTKDRANQLKTALSSVSNQKNIDFEIVLVNDGSTDNTESVASEIKTRIPNFVYIVNEESKGVAHARQQALQNSQGEYVAILDDDDEWVNPSKLKQQAEFLDHNADIGIVGTYVEIYNTENGKTTIWQPPLNDTQLRDAMLYKTPFLNTATMMRRELALRSGGFNKSLKFAEDYTLWLEMGLSSKFANLDIVGTRVTQHDTGLTQTNAVQMIWYVIKCDVKYRKKYPNWLKALIKLIPQYIFVSVFGIKAWKKMKSKIYDTDRS